jgi:ABC-type antimicrobial peptide transport system permease subunit
MERVMLAVAGFFIGGLLGWFMGVAWYELIEVPKAASMDPATVPSYLCATGNALSLLAVPGAVLGAIVGALKNLATVRRESRDQPQ